MDLHDGDRGHGDAPAAPLTAAEESDAAAAAENGRLLCAQCIGILGSPAGFVRGASGYEVPLGDVGFTVAEARAAVDGGHVLVHNINGLVPVYAVTTIRGTAACALHAYVTAMEQGKFYPFAF